MLNAPPSISRRLQGVEPSGTVRVFELARKLRGQGRNIISLAVGEPDFEPPASVIAATQRALAEHHTRYGAVCGIDALRSKLAEAFPGYGPGNIIITNGAKQGLFSLFQVLLNPGDAVVLSKPCWVSFTEQIKLAGGRPVLVETDHHQLDPDAIGAAVTDNTRAIVINTPNNPTGAVYNRSALASVARIADQYGCWVIFDEAYHAFTFGDRRHVDTAALPLDPHLKITVRSFSKHYNMTGFRIGYVAADRSVIKAMADLQSHLCGNVCSFAQYGALAALEMNPSGVECCRKELERRRDVAYALTRKMFDCVRPDGAFYLFPNVEQVLRTGESSADFALRLLKETGVAVVPGEAFGMSGHIRISFGIQIEQLQDAFERMRQGI